MIWAKEKEVFKFETACYLVSLDNNDLVIID